MGEEESEEWRGETGGSGEAGKGRRRRMRCGEDT